MYSRIYSRKKLLFIMHSLPGYYICSRKSAYTYTYTRFRSFFDSFLLFNNTLTFANEEN